MIESDNLHKTDYVDLVLLYLSTLYIKTGRPALSDFIQSVPYFSGFYLRQNEKLSQVLFFFEIRRVFALSLFLRSCSLISVPTR